MRNLRKLANNLAEIAVMLEEDPMASPVIRHLAVKVIREAVDVIRERVSESATPSVVTEEV